MPGPLPFPLGGVGGAGPNPNVAKYFWQPEPGVQQVGKWSNDAATSKGYNEMLWANSVTIDKRVNVGPGVTKFVRIGIWFPVEGTADTDFNTDVNGSSIVRLVNFGTRIQPIEGMRR